MKKIIKAVLGEKLYKVFAKALITNRIQQTVKRLKEIRHQFNAEDAVSFLMHRAAKEVRPWQIYSEIQGLARVIEEKKPKTVLEIGTADGGTLLLTSCLADPEALMISIDLQDGQFGGGYPEWKRKLYQSFAKEKQQIILIQDDSHLPSIFEQLKHLLNGKTIDYLFIDGDHTYEGVKQDFEMYSPLVGKGGFIAFHDIAADHGTPKTHFVHEFWNEIKSNYRYQEFVDNPGQSKCGIGVLFVD